MILSAVIIGGLLGMTTYCCGISIVDMAKELWARMRER
jgi:hypothetical protein